MEEKKNNKVFILAIVILVIVCACAFFVGINNKNNNSNTGGNISNNNDTNINYEDTSLYTNALELCELKDYSGVYEEAKDNQNCSSNIIKIKTKTNNLKYYSGEGMPGYFIYSDDGIIKVYDLNVGKSLSTNLKNDTYEPFNLVIIEDTIKGLIVAHNVNDESYYEYYQFDNNKLLYQNKYKEELSYLNGNALVVYEKTKIDGKEAFKSILLNTEKEEVIDEINSIAPNGYPAWFNVDSGDYITIYYNDGKNERSKAYTLDFKVLDSDFSFDSVFNKNLALLKNNVVSIYDKNGSLTKKIDKYDNILSMAGEYIIISKNDKINYVSFDGIENEIDIKYKSNDYFGYSTYDEENKTLSLLIGNNDVKFDDYYKDYEKSKSKEYTKNELKKCKYNYEYTYNLETKEITKDPSPFCN